MSSDRKMHIITFLSTLSLRRATGYFTRNTAAIRISIHALLAESDIVASHSNIALDISIHALLAESDIVNGVDLQNYYSISIHALLAESDRGAAIESIAPQTFLSTLSLRRATVSSKL